MKLKNVSRFFDRTSARDGYTGLMGFKCQLEPFDMFRTDGARVKVRNMSTAPEVLIPTRRVIDIDGQKYLVGDGTPDHWNGEKVRTRYVLQGADALVQIQTIAQVLANTAGTTAYGSIEFNKASTDERDNSDFHPQYHLYFGASESAPKNSILSAGGKYYLVREAHLALGGLLDALCNEIDSPVIDAATFASRAYDPVTDAYTDTPTTVRCVRVRWQDHFAYLSQGSEKYERGDMQAFVPTSVTPKSGDKLTLSDGAWTILSVLDEGTYRSLHIRRA